LISKEEMIAIGNNFGIDVRVGEYDYACCYSKEDFEAGNWKGRWFAINTDKFVIFMPTSYDERETVYSFFHELGHAIQHLYMPESISVWHEEVKCWIWAKLFISLYYEYDQKDYLVYVDKCLSTYVDKEVERTGKEASVLMTSAMGDLLRAYELFKFDFSDEMMARVRRVLID
jgi:hypothetical protein